MKLNELKAIEIGKIWMKNSVDNIHDDNHCIEVEKHALKILPFFKKLDDTLDENLVRLAVWWHDSYKVRVKNTTFKSTFFEGSISEKIFFNEAGSLISDERAKRIGLAIRYHANPIYFLIMKYKTDPLVNILIESDQIEGFNIERNRLFLKKTKSPIQYLFAYIQILLIPIYVKLISRSDYAKKFINYKSL